MDKEKRRDVNFSREETEKLKELVEQNKFILLNTKTTSVVNRLKDDTWNSIAEEFNAFSSNYRTPKQLKHKFENIKKRAQMEYNKNLEDSKIFNQRLPPVESSDAEWVRGLTNDFATEVNGGDQEADTTHDSKAPETPKKEHRTHTVFRRKLSSVSDIKHRILQNRELVSKKENSLLLSQLQELHKQEMAHKTERHRAQLEHEEKLNEAQLNKLAIEARLYEAQLHKIALETKQLELQQSREAELHAIKLARETELHQARLAREAELHAAMLARESGQHLSNM